MDPVNKSVAEEIDSGKYFVEAMKWYNSVFLKPISDTALMFATSIVVSVTLLFALYSINSVFPLEKRVQIVVSLGDTSDFYPVLKKISNSKDSTKDAVVKYLASKYVISREGFNRLTFKMDYFFVLNSSVKKVFNGYYEFIQSEAKSSPLLAKKQDREIKIEDILPSFDTKNNLVNIKFSKRIYNSNDKLISETRWNAKVGFKLTDYDFSVSENAQLRFIVMGYELKEIK